MEKTKEDVFEATREEAKNRQVTGILMALDGVLSELANEVSGSLKLLDLGEETEMTKNIKKSIESPWSNLHKVSTSVKNSVNSYKSKLIRTLVVAKRDNLIFASYAHDSESTHVFLGLKEDTMDIRDEFYDFLDLYEGQEVSKASPIIIHFTDKETIASIHNINNIDLNESSYKTMHS